MYIHINDQLHCGWQKYVQLNFAQNLRCNNSYALGRNFAKNVVVNVYLFAYSCTERENFLLSVQPNVASFPGTGQNVLFARVTGIGKMVPLRISRVCSVLTSSNKFV